MPPDGFDFFNVEPELGGDEPGGVHDERDVDDVRWLSRLSCTIICSSLSGDHRGSSFEAPQPIAAAEWWQCFGRKKIDNQ